MTKSEANCDVEAVYRLANSLKDTRADEALDLYLRALEMDPEHVPSRHNLAVLLEQKGRFAEAIPHYETVRRLNPAHVKSMARLIAMRPDDTLIKEAKQRLTAGRIADDERIRLHQALGKYYDRQRKFDQAFGHFSAAKATVRKHSGAFDEPALAKYFDRIMETFSASCFASQRAEGSDSPRPVFIVGMPRSGTSLTEQILSSHPAVFGAGELKAIPDIVTTMRAEYPQCIAKMDAPQLQALAKRYLEDIDKLAPAGALRVSDKLPVNFMHLGLIATLFPKAHVIHCRRDPLDIALSCFIELFKLKQDFTTDLDSIGRYYLQYERLMAHWRKVLPMPLHEQRYEQLVADPATASRALIEYCGLPWDDACLNFQGAERAVATPSRWQVRQPIYPSSVGRWRNYASHLDSIRQLLAARHHAYVTGA